MNARAFVKVVAEMMTAQADYWKSRTQSALIKSKNLEKQVRRALAEGISFPDEIALTPDLQEEEGEPKQAGLFE